VWKSSVLIAFISSKKTFASLIFVLIAQYGFSQSDLFPSPQKLLSSIENDRFRSNALCLRNGKKTTWDKLELLSPSSIDSFFVVFSTDSVFWNFRSAKVEYTVCFPNDFGLLKGLDRPELQAEFADSIKCHAHFSAMPQIDTAAIDTFWLLHGIQYNTLRGISVLKKSDSTAICRSDMPIESALNSLNDTLTCNGIYNLRLVLHQYGNKRDTLSTGLPGFIKATGAYAWPKWYGIDENGIIALLQHPYWGFTHMLYLRLITQNGEKFWLGDLHTYIPTHNIANLYGSYKQKKGAERLIIK